jgi:hypothetical protein
MPLELVYADNVRNTSPEPLTASLEQLPSENVSIDDAMHPNRHPDTPWKEAAALESFV